jgi:hypothetical protein
VVCLGLLYRNILLFWVFVGMRGFVVRLHSLFHHWDEFVIFRRELYLRVGLFCLRGGVWSVRLVG